MGAFSQASMTCEVRFHPFGVEDVDAAVDEALELIGSFDLKMDTGPLSTVVKGTPAEVFAMLKTLYERMETRHAFTLDVTLSNYCR